MSVLAGWLHKGLTTAQLNQAGTCVTIAIEAADL